MHAKHKIHLLVIGSALLMATPVFATLGRSLCERPTHEGCAVNFQCASVFRTPDYGNTTMNRVYDCTNIAYTPSTGNEGYYGCCPDLDPAFPQKKVWVKGIPSDPSNIIAGIPIDEEPPLTAKR